LEFGKVILIIMVDALEKFALKSVQAEV